MESTTNANELVVKLVDCEIAINKKLVFSNLNLEVKKGDFIFLIGQTGSGKSTLIRLLYGDLVPKRGSAQVVGFNLNKIKPKEIPKLRRKLGIVFQDFKLLDDRSIHQNLSFVLKSTGWKSKNNIKQKVLESLQQVKVYVDSNKYPFEISGGEQQRVAIARAILNEPILIIADEPTGNLDPNTSVEIMQLFEMLHKKGMTIIMSTHDYAMVKKFSGKIYRIDDGQIQEVFKKIVPRRLPNESQSDSN